MRTLLCAAAVLLCAGSSLGGVTAPPKLKTVSRAGEYSVQLPSTWRFVDASYPSDHSTHIWFDPTNPLKRLIVTQDACAGCVAGITDFRRMSKAKIRSYLPTVTRIWVDGRYRVRYLSYDEDPWNRVYPENGLLAVDPDGPVFSSGVHLWLPASARATAVQILRSFVAA